MAHELKHGILAGLTRWQAFCYVILPFSAIIGLVMAIISGVFGWQGKGVAGEWAGPGFEGMFFGTLGGASLGLFIAGAFGVGLWAIENKPRTYLLLLFCFGYLVIHHGLGAVPRFALLMAIGIIVTTIMRWAKKRSQTNKEKVPEIVD